MQKQPITKATVIDRLEENGLAFQEVPVSEKRSVIVTAHGGRVFGPFGGADQASLLWLNDGFGERERFSRVLADGLPLGGERLWISPEIQYGVTDRTNFWETLFIPDAVDPGNYEIETNTIGEVKLSQQIELQAHNIGFGMKKLTLARTIQATSDPLRHLAEYDQLTRNIEFAGYRHTVCLRDLAPDGIRSEAWSLIQVNPGGTVLLPALSRPEYHDYFEPAPSDLVSSRDRELRAKITGRRQYKIGVKSTNTIGRAAYLSPLDGERHALILRSFHNDPALPYADEPPQNPGEAGFSIHIYNDDGRFGGFGELENMAGTIGGSAHRAESTDLFELWVYYGSIEALRGVALHLLGVELL